MQLLYQGDEVGLVLWGSSPLSQILPIQVECIKVVLLNKLDRAVHKILPFHRVQQKLGSSEAGPTVRKASQPSKVQNYINVEFCQLVLFHCDIYCD